MTRAVGSIRRGIPGITRTVRPLPAAGPCALAGCPAAVRSTEPARAWKPQLGDRFCGFSDRHAMLAYVGAPDGPLADRFEQDLLPIAAARTRLAETARDIGLPACQALLAFGRGDHPRAADWIGGLPAKVKRIGRSRAQPVVPAFHRPGWRGSDGDDHESPALRHEPGLAVATAR